PLLSATDLCQVPIVSSAASAEVVQPVSERYWVFTTPPLDSTMVSAEVKDMVDRGITTVGFIGFSDAYGKSGLTEFKEAIEGTDIEIVDVEQFSREDTNVNSQAAKLVDVNPDAILIWAIPPGANVAQKGIQKAGYEGTIYQSYGVSNETFLRL